MYVYPKEDYGQRNTEERWQRPWNQGQQKSRRMHHSPQNGKGKKLNYTENNDGSLTREDGVIIPEKARTRNEIYTRVIGYLRPVEQFNVGQQASFHDRKVYKVNI